MAGWTLMPIVEFVVETAKRVLPYCSHIASRRSPLSIAGAASSREEIADRGGRGGHPRRCCFRIAVLAEWWSGLDEAYRQALPR